MKSLVFVLLLLAGQTSNAMATTWFVERDGTGDFTTIQPAVNAAASGDTIRIGPGRYNEIGEAACNTSSLDVRIFVIQYELTIIGSGPELTIIGPEAYSPDLTSQTGVTAYQPCGSENLTIQNLQFQNLSVGVHSEFGNRLSIDNCLFFGNCIGIVTDWHEVIVTNSKCFEGALHGVFITAYLGSAVETFIFKDCISRGSEDSFDFSHVGVSATQLQIVSDCEFTNGSTGVVFLYGNPKIKNCTFSQLKRGIRIDGGTGHVDHCTFSDVEIGVQDNSYGYGTLEMKNSVFSNVEESCFQYRSFVSGAINDCILDKGSRYVVSYHPYSSESELDMDFTALPEMDPEARSQRNLQNKAVPALPLPEEYHFDMTNNWWGTSDPDSIQAWIEDGEDHLGSPYFVDWFPYKTNTVSDTKQTFGGMKAFFESVLNLVET